jgi:hypothetical protein
VDKITFQQLLSPAGQEVILAAAALSPKESDFLKHFQELSRHFPPEMARSALEIAILRREAAKKFPFAEKLYLTRTALEQASSIEISSFRAERYRPFPYLADLGCSIGGDTIALANIAPTIGLDADELRLVMAFANLGQLNLLANSRLIQSNLTASLPFSPGSVALFFDPSRRSGYRRLFSIHDYQPPLSIIKEWIKYFPALGVKISPGVNLAELAGYDAEVEFISLHGELKEAVLWFGPLKTAHRRATILPGPFQLSALQPNPSDKIPNLVNEPKLFLYEPDPAVIRSGLLTSLAELLDASQIDPDIAYLTSDKLSATPFARCWSVIDWFPIQLKRLRAYLRQNHVGHVTVKKRGSPLEPELLIHQLRLKGDQECVLALTHLHGAPIVIICNGL